MLDHTLTMAVPQVVKEEGEGSFSGGLGSLMTDVSEVWVCLSQVF